MKKPLPAGAELDQSILQLIPFKTRKISRVRAELGDVFDLPPVDAAGMETVADFVASLDRLDEAGLIEILGDPENPFFQKSGGCEIDAYFTRSSG